jgi:uncharacterized membrane protein YphA (DoxX/SURF4 family)
MNTAVWVVQILLALAFLMAGLMKLTQPMERLAQRMSWVNDFSPLMVRGIGAIEFSGAIGVILPAWTGILPWLTPLAATGLGIVMLGAMATHLRRHEQPRLVGNIVLLALAVFVVYGRFVAVPL